MFQRIRLLLEMIRFSHTIFALPFALLAAAMAWLAPTGLAEGGNPFRWLDLVGILLCMVTARSAAMAFNRLVDYKIDAKNPRTANRHLPSGALSVGSVVSFTVITSLMFVASTLLFLPNWLPIALSLPVLCFLMLYSLTKRVTSLAHFWLGVSLMIAPICVWIALRGELLIANPLDITPAVVLGFAIFLWVAGFDIIYSCQDAEFDTEAKLHSVPTRLGVPGALRLAAICHLLMLIALAALPLSAQIGGPELSLGWIYYAGVIGVAILLIYEHLLVRPDDLTRVNIAFFNVNAIVSIGLLIVGIVDLLV